MRCIIALLGTVVMVTIVGWTLASPGYCTSLSFSQGFDLETGLVEDGIKKLLEQGTESPDVIRLVFVAEDLEPENTFYSFQPEIDFQIGYDEGYDFFGFLPLESTAIAVVDNARFDSIEMLDLNALDFSYDPAEIQFDPDYSLVVLTADNNFFTLGNFSWSGGLVSFDSQKIENITAPVPEPSTLVLFGL